MTDSRNLSDDRKQTRNELLENRMLDFAVEVIGCLDSHKTIPRAVADQLIRSCTSIGANYAEACNAISKADFKNKIFIAKKEAAETRYWIDLCIKLSKSSGWTACRQEAHELLIILQAIVNTISGKPVK